MSNKKSIQKTERIKSKENMQRERIIHISGKLLQKNMQAYKELATK